MPVCHREICLPEILSSGKLTWAWEEVSKEGAIEEVCTQHRVIYNSMVHCYEQVRVATISQPLVNVPWLPMH